MIGWVVGGCGVLDCETATCGSFLWSWDPRTNHQDDITIELFSHHMGTLVFYYCGIQLHSTQGCFSREVERKERWCTKSVAICQKEETFWDVPRVAFWGWISNRQMVKVKVPLCLWILPSKHVDNVIVGLREFLRLDSRVHWPASQADSVNIHCQSFCIVGKAVARGWP